MAPLCTLTAALVAVWALHVVSAGSARPQYYDAIVVDAESRSDDSDTDSYDNIQLQDCLLPASTGPCRGLFESYFYNAKEGRCEKFTYSGCGGNKNRFKTAQKCEVACRSAKKLLSEERCGSVNPACDRGCFVITDNYDCPRCECSPKIRAALCSQPPVKGHCRALLSRWRYDVYTKTCSEFKFGGCDGNGNNFVSELDCLNACSGV